jgi:hypothetical protein
MDPAANWAAAHPHLAAAAMAAAEHSLGMQRQQSHLGGFSSYFPPPYHPPPQTQQTPIMDSSVGPPNMGPGAPLAIRHFESENKSEVENSRNMRAPPVWNHFGDPHRTESSKF